MDTLLDGVAVTTAIRDESGRVVDFRRDYANPAMGAISGVPADEQIGHTLLELFPAHVPNGLFDAYVRVVETGIPFESAAFHYVDPDAPGGPLDQFLEQRVARMGDGYVIAERDVTEVERARREHERLAAVVEESPDGILVADAEGRIVYANSAFAGDLGREPSDLAGLDVLDLVGGVVDATMIAAIVEIAESGRPWVGEADWRRPDGTVGRVDLRITPRLASDGSVEGHVVVARDVTERKRIQTALELSELRYSTAFHTSPDAVNLNRMSDGLYLDISDGFTASTGFTWVDVEGKTSGEIAIWADPETRDALVAGLRADGVVNNLEMRFRRKDGSLGTGLMSARVIEVDGEPCILSMTRDITDRKEAEERFRALEAQLRQAQKMEAIGQLAGGIAHDFNNLLTAIRGSASLALAQLPTDSGVREDLEEIEKTADRAAGLTRQLLAFARRAVFQPEVVSLSAIVRGLESMLGRLLGENVRLVTVTSDGSCCVLADPGQIEQVIVNLAVNARDAMPDGGTLTIETANSTAPSANGRMTTLSVRDTGFGMDAEVMSHLFEPFFTTKEPGKGTGLGLSAAYGIVSASGGTITASSEPGKGSTFTVFLPLVDGATAPGPESPRPGPSRGAGTGTILLVEDDAGVRSFASRVLRAAGYRVLVAEDGAAAVEMSRSGPVQLLLTDMVMPGMSGRDVAAKLAAAQPRMRVLYMSGYTDKGIVHDGTLEPDIQFLAKPFKSEALLQAVEGAMGRAPARMG